MLAIKNKGFSIVEIIVASAIFLVTSAAFVFSFEVLDNLSKVGEEKMQTALLLEEGAEAMLLLRDQSWATIEALDLDEPYSLYWDDGSYETSASDVTIMDDYIRRVTLSAVHRTGTGALASSGTIDPDTKHVLIEVVAATGGEVLATAEMLIHNSHE